MRPIPLLLRVLLCLLLVVHGVAGAQAAARMGVMHGATTTKATPPCHRDAGVATTSMHGEHAATHAADAAHAPDRGCCAGAPCDGLCAPPLVQLPASPLLLPAFAHTIPPPQRRDDGRAPPPLPHVLRPPIG